MVQDSQLKYIRGFTDGEGTPVMYRGSKTKNGKKYPQWDRKIKISNSDKELLLTIQEVLLRVGIESHIYLDHAAGSCRSTKDCWGLVVLGKGNIQKFVNMVGFTEPRKIETAKKLLGSYRR